MLCSGLVIALWQHLRFWLFPHCLIILSIQPIFHTHSQVLHLILPAPTKRFIYLYFVFRHCFRVFVKIGLLTSLHKVPCLSCVNFFFLSSRLIPLCTCPFEFEDLFRCSSFSLFLSISTTFPSSVDFVLAFSSAAANSSSPSCHSLHHQSFHLLHCNLFIIFFFQKFCNMFMAIIFPCPLFSRYFSPSHRIVDRVFRHCSL